MIAFVVIVLGVFSLIYGFTGWRLIAPLSLHRRWKLVAGLVVALLMSLLFLLRFGKLGLPDSAYDTLVWTAHVTFAFVLITWLLLVPRDACWLLLRVMQRVRTTVHRTRIHRKTASVDPARRLFLLNAANLGTVGLSSGLVGLGLHSARRKIRVEQVRVPVPGLPESLEGLRILQFSDLHVGLTIRRAFVERVVEHVEDLSADLIALTGDLIDGDVTDLRHDVEPLARLQAPLGCFFVTGNHEYYNNDLEGWLTTIRLMGYRVLINEHQVISRGNGRLVLAGVTDYNAGSLVPAHRSSPERSIHGAPAGIVKVLLAHQPRSIFSAAREGFDLQLSGHTHGGQFIPWKYAVRLQQPYIAGLHRHQNTWIYVNRGVGYWGPPLRLGSPAEITVLTLTGGPAGVSRV